MKKKLKIQCIYLAVLILVGIIAGVLAFLMPNWSEMQKGFATGFGVSILIAGGAILIKNLIALNNPEKLKRREIEMTDERSVHIYEKAMAITFRICLMLQAIASIVLVGMNNELGVNLGLIAGCEMIIFIICSAILSKRN